LGHLDSQAERIVMKCPPQTQKEIEVIFANDEYEAKLRYIRNESPKHGKL
jgi:hypothetical protein